MKLLRHRTRRGADDRRIARLSVELFEYTIADRESALIRLACRWTTPPAALPGLVLRTGGEQLTMKPLPGARAQPEGDCWQGGYVADAASVRAADARFSLALDGEAELALPSPVERTLPGSATPPASELSGDDARALVEVLEQRCRISERAVSELRAASQDSEKLVKAWRECAELRELLESREATHAAAKAEAGRLRARYAELEQGLDSAVSRLAEIRESADAERDRLQAELDARRQSDALNRAALEEAERRGADAQEAHERVDAARAEVASLQHQLKDAADTLSRMEAEAERQVDQLVALKRRAEAAEAAAEQHSAAIGRLQAELDAARAALPDADRHAKERESELQELSSAEQRAVAAEERTKVLEAHAAEASRLRQKLERVQARQRGGRRTLFGRRAEGEAESQLGQQVAENAGLTEQIAYLTEQIRTLEADRAADVGSTNLERQALEAELKRQQAVAEDLRTLLDTERKQAAAARSRADTLRGRLAEVPATAPGPLSEPERSEGDPAGRGDGRVGWSAMDKELLERLERAKALTAS